MFKPVENIYQLVYPSLCTHCGQKSTQTGVNLCTDCWIGLKKAKLYLDPTENRLEKLFWGRIELEGAYTAFEYQKDSIAADMIKALKYKKQPQLGVELGKLMIEEISNYTSFKVPDLILPIPLHKKKAFKRGYNQSLKLCEGVAEVIPTTVNEKLLKRKDFNVTQTQKHQFERWKNVKDIFEPVQTPNVAHVMLIDDVVTTGATLEAAAHKLKAMNYRVSIATFAITTQEN